MDWIHRIGICHYSIWIHINPSKSPYDQLEGSISYENESTYEAVQSNLMSSVPSPSLKTCLSELLREEQRSFTQVSMEQKGILPIPLLLPMQVKPSLGIRARFNVIVARNMITLEINVRWSSAITKAATESKQL